MKPIVVGISGGSGSGKTTFTDAVIKALGKKNITLLRHDYYYHDQARLPMEERKQINYDHPDSLDNELLLKHMKELKKGKIVKIPTYNFASYTRGDETVKMDPQKVVIVEGILIFVDKAMRDQFDIKIFIDTDDDLRILRRIDRDMRERGRSLDNIMSQYMETVKPMHLEFVEPSKRWADIIIPRGVENKVGLEIVIDELKGILRGKKE